MSLSLVYDRIDHFRDFNIWPRQQELNVERWIENFQLDEIYIAERLLANFTYFNRSMTSALLRNAIQKFLSDAWYKPGFQHPPSFTNLNDISFVLCEGEEPHSTDSGNLFARKLRDELRIPEPFINSAAAALGKSSTIKHYIFVDDFSGSGNQFKDTINRIHNISGTPMSFAHLLNDNKHSISYCPCIATNYSKNDTIAPAFPSINLFPAHILSDAHNATLQTSRIWRGLDGPDANAAIAKLKTISIRAGYPREDFGQDDWRGFHGLGLSVAFEHGIPDASLPLFFSERNGWKPLMRRA